MLQNIHQKFSINKQSFIIFTTCSSIILYLILYIIFGNRGISDYLELRKSLQERNLVKDQLYLKIKDKKNTVERLRNNSLDLDLLDEQVKKNLGYSNENEIIIYEDKTSESN